MRWVLPVSLLAVNLSGFVLLMTVGQVLAPTKPINASDSRLRTVEVGQQAPDPLLATLKDLPATVVVFPSCNECTIEDPSMLRGQKFNKRVVVVLPGADAKQLAKYGEVNENALVVSGEEALAEFLGIEAVPKVFTIGTDGTFSFVQPAYVPIKQLHEVINGS